MPLWPTQPARNRYSQSSERFQSFRRGPIEERQVSWCWSGLDPLPSGAWGPWCCSGRWLGVASDCGGPGTRGTGLRWPSRASPLPPLPTLVRSHGSPLPHGRGPQQRPQSDKEREQAEAQPPPWGEFRGHERGDFWEGGGKGLPGGGHGQGQGSRLPRAVGSAVVGRAEERGCQAGRSSE